MKRFGLGAIACILVLTGAGCSAGGEEDQEDLTYTFTNTVEDQTDSQPSWEFPGVLSEGEIQNKQVRLKTTKGDIVFELYADTAPKTVSNFVYLTNDGYYNGLSFHRREEGFVIQGGDPSGNGSGGPGYTFEDEFNDDHQYDKGIVAMANRGPDTNGSQFFIMLADVPLPKAYTIFGRVTEGLEAVEQIQIGDVMETVVVEDKQ